MKDIRETNRNRCVNGTQTEAGNFVQDTSLDTCYRDFVQDTSLDTCYRLFM